MKTSLASAATNISQAQAAIEAALRIHLPRGSRGAVSRLNEALEYAVFKGGKRFRAVLVLMGGKVVGMESPVPALPAACALEFVHASSLILDDLPCMDNADLRRFNPTLHKVYGEDTAVLTALALLNQAYAIFGRTPGLIQEATDCIGIEGMIGGQFLDLQPPNSQDWSLVDRNRKTSALMQLALTAGALSCGAPKSSVEALGKAGRLLGEAYQINDDSLDLHASSSETGKTPEQDLRHNRPSHASGTARETCQAQVAGLIEEAQRTLLQTFGSTDPVADIIIFAERIFGKHQVHSSLDSAAMDYSVRRRNGTESLRTNFLHRK